MNAFAAAIDVLFADPHMAVDAVYRVGGIGEGAPVRLIEKAPDEVFTFGEGRFVTDTHFFDVRVSEAPALSEGDSFTVGDDLFEVRSEPKRDRLRLVWTCEVRTS